MPTGVAITQEQIDFIVHNFSEMSNPELARAVGLSPSGISKIQHRYNLRKSAEHLHRMSIRAGKASNVARGGKALNITPEVIAKRVAAYVETKRIEETRVKWGLPQRTKIKLKHEPERKADQRAYLRALGYIVDNENLIAYYTKDTRRARMLERVPRGETRGRLHSYYEFKPYEER